MKNHIEKISESAKKIYELTEGKEHMTRAEHKLIQNLIDELQEACDEVANALIPWED